MGLRFGSEEIMRVGDRRFGSVGAGRRGVEVFLAKIKNIRETESSNLGVVKEGVFKEVAADEVQRQ